MTMNERAGTTGLVVALILASAALSAISAPRAPASDDAQAVDKMRAAIARGTRHFAQITEDNVGRPFAIVLDDQVLSVSVIREPILGGSGVISGDFTLEEANTIAMMLALGTLPGRLSVVDRQVVEPAGNAGK